MKRIVIVGATSAIAQACALQWLAQRDIELVLVGRDQGRTEQARMRLLAHAQGSTISLRVCDFHDHAAIAALAGALASAGAIDIVLIAHGYYPDQGAGDSTLEAMRAAIDANAVSPVLFAQAFAGHLGAAGQGTLALIGSVAGDRGRKSNYVYGAAKSLVERFAQGLQHRFAGTGVRVVLIKPGPVDTPMTAQAKRNGTRVAPLAQVAREIVAGIARGRAVVYTPARWRWIMLAVVHLPRVLFNRLDI